MVLPHRKRGAIVKTKTTENLIVDGDRLPMILINSSSLIVVYNKAFVKEKLSLKYRLLCFCNELDR